MIAYICAFLGSRYKNAHLSQTSNVNVNSTHRYVFPENRDLNVSVSSDIVMLLKNIEELLTIN